nr:MAG TPA: hypothetical protein [Caudoviricetes sp.]
MVNQEQMFTVMVIVGVIFSILTNVALYYYGEYRTLRKKLEHKEELHVKTEDFVERHNRKITENRISQLENRVDNLVVINIKNRENITHNFEEVKTEILEIKAQLNVVANNDELVKKEFLFNHIRNLERKIYDIKDHVFGKGVSDGSEKG